MAQKSDKSDKSNSITLSKCILSKIGELGICMLDGFFPKKYPEARIWRNVLGLDDNYEFSKKKFSAIVSKLQSQGLVKRIGPRKKAFWTLTQKGKSCLTNNKFEAGISQIHSDGIQRIVIFDIPERERKKRAWIRYNLMSFGYEQMQKSVWSGKSPLPNYFLQDIQTLELEKCVHIFSVRDPGTLERIQ